MDSLKDQTAIVGIGWTEFSKSSGRTEWSMATEAAVKACADAGIAPNQIDGIVRSSFDAVLQHQLVKSLGIDELTYHGEVGFGGGAPCAVATQAAMAVASGMAEYVLCFRSVNLASGQRYGVSRAGGRVGGEMAYYTPYGFLAPAQWIAMFAQRHMHEYGTTSRQLGAIAVSQRANANRNPNATMKGALTIDDHQSARIIADPLRLFDCCLNSDGCCAFIVTSAERARDLPQRPAYIMGMAMGLARNQEVVRTYNRPSMTEFPETKLTSARLFRMAGVAPGDIDVAQIYDHFTPGVLIALEDWGFCEKGQGGPFVESGAISWPDGSLPVNTHGGNLSEAYIHGFTHILEGVRQVRGASTSQVKDVELSFVASAAFVPTSALILH